MNIIGLVTLVFGSISSYLFVYYIDQSEHRLTSSIIFKTVSIYLSLLILIGYILDSLKLHVYTIYYLIVFIAILVILSAKARKKIFKPKIVSYLNLVSFFGLVFFGFIILIKPFIGVWFPLARSVDAAHHFAYIEHIFRNQLITQENFYYQGTGITNYPFGAHLITAFFSSVFDLQPIRLTYPFMALVVAFTAGAVYIISCESKISRIGALAGGFLTILTSYFFITLIHNGSWGQVVGNFLIMAFAIFSIDYLRESTLIKMFQLILINLAIVLTYTFYIPIPLILLTILIYKEGASKRLIRHLSFFLVSYILLTPFLVRLMAYKSNLFIQGGVPHDILQNFGQIFLIFFIYGIIITMKSTEKFVNSLVASGLLIAMVIQTSLIWLGILIFGIADYWFYKMFLLMVFPLGIFATIGIDSLADRFHKLLRKEKRGNIKSYFLIVFLMSLTFASTFIQIYYIHYYSLNEKPVITSYEYDALMWIDSNMPMNDKVAYVTDNDWIRTFWLIGISHRMSDMLKPSDIIRYIQYDQFIGYLATHAKDGTIIYIQNTTRVNYSKDIIFLENTNNNNLDYLISSLKELYRKNDTAIYQFNSDKLTNSSVIFLDDNWYPLESSESAKISWISNNATILYYSPKNRNSKLLSNIISFNKPRLLQVYVNDELKFQRIVSQQEISMKIQINKGKNTIRFYTTDGCQRPIDIPELKSQDVRCLSLAFQNITIT